MGRGAVATEPDEVVLDCRDDYQGLPDKVRAICRWSVEHGYQYTVKVDDDTLLLPGWTCPRGDFTGRHNSFVNTLKIKQPWGFCYALSNRSASIIAQAELPPHNCDERWVTQELYKHGITLTDEPRYCLHGGTAEEFVGIHRCMRGRTKRTLSPFGEVRSDATAISTYIEWLSFHGCPDGRVIQELRKIWKEKIMSVQDTTKQDLKNHNNRRDGRLPEGVVPTDADRFAPVSGPTANEALAKNPKKDMDFDCR